MSKSTVIQDIKSKIRPNGEQSITGQVLQDVLVESVNLVPEKVSELVNDSQYQTKANLDTALASKANASDIPTKTSQLANDSGFMTSTEVSTTYATKAEVPTKTSQLANDSTYQTKANLDTALATKADKSSLASKQDKLVSGTNIKTINDQSILGSGNISIESGTSITVDSALSTTSENPVQNKVVTAELNKKPGYTNVEGTPTLMVSGGLIASGKVVGNMFSSRTDRGNLTLNDKTWYSDNKVDIFRWDGKGKGDVFTLTSDVDSDAGYKILSLGNNTDTNLVQYLDLNDYLGTLTFNCNLSLSGTPGKERPEFRIIDFSGVRESSISEWISIYYVDGLFKMDYTDTSTGELRTENLLEIRPKNREFRVLGQNLVLQQAFDTLDFRVEDLENSLGDIDTALNTILGNS